MICFPSSLKQEKGTEGPRITRVSGLQKKPVLCKIRISGTLGGPLLMQKSPTCAYIGQNSISGFHVNGGPPVANSWLSASNFQNSVPALKNWENK